jgi:signal peptidase I
VKGQKKGIGNAVLNVCLVLASLVMISMITYVVYKVSHPADDSFFGYKPILIETDSMEDTVMTGALLIGYKEDFFNLQVGDVITFERFEDKKLNTHRIIALEDGLAITQGDNSGIPDAIPVSANNYKYKAIWVMNWVPQLGQWPGMLTVLVWPVGVLILLVVLCLFAPRFARRVRDRWAANKAARALRPPPPPKVKREKLVKPAKQARETPPHTAPPAAPPPEGMGQGQPPPPPVQEPTHDAPPPEGSRRQPPPREPDYYAPPPEGSRRQPPPREPDYYAPPPEGSRRQPPPREPDYYAPPPEGSRRQPPVQEPDYYPPPPEVSRRQPPPREPDYYAPPPGPSRRRPPPREPDYYGRPPEPSRLQPPVREPRRGRNGAPPPEREMYPGADYGPDISSYDPYGLNAQPLVPPPPPRPAAGWRDEIFDEVNFDDEDLRRAYYQSLDEDDRP